MRNFIFLFFLILLAPSVFAQFPVVLTLADGPQTQTAVNIRGSYNGWMNEAAVDDGTNGDVTAGDNIWSLTIMAQPGMYEWGAEDATTAAWLLTGPNPSFTVDAAGGVTGTTEYVIPVGVPTDVLLTVTDLNMDIDSISFKGSYGGWSSQNAYDDGTNGDVTAGDGVWSLLVSATSNNTYEWGAERLDCPDPSWVIQGSNPSFSIDNAQVITGTTNYEIPLKSTTYNVTFRVDMTNEIISSNGLFVAGNFQECPWSKTQMEMTLVPGTTSCYQFTAPVAAGTYQFKFFNGDQGDADAEGQDPIFITESCGSDNGFGGSNRDIDLSGLTGDMVLDAVIYNSCVVSSACSVSGTKDLNSLAAFSVTPNPFSTDAVIEFENTNNEVYELTITSLTGKVVQSLSGLTGTQVRISRDELSSGLYFATLKNEEGKFHTSKIMIQ